MDAAPSSPTRSSVARSTRSRVDLYDHEAASPVLDSLAFYRDCLAALAERGAMSVNLFGRDASFERSFERIGEAFGAGACSRSSRPRRQHRRHRDEACHAPGRDVLARRAENIETRWQLPARKWLRMLRLPEPAPTQLPELPPA